MSFENFPLERDGAVAVLTINRPRIPRALNSSTIDRPRRTLGLEHAAVRFPVAGVSRRLKGSFDQRQCVEAVLFGPIASNAGIREGAPAFLETRKARVTGR